jgi:3-deoxy-7-phosphoheptulonate synthase
VILLVRDEAALRTLRERLLRRGADVHRAADRKGSVLALKIDGAPPGYAAEAGKDASVLAVLEDEPEAKLARASLGEPVRFEVGGVTFGEGLVVAAGPCAVEDEATLDRIAARLAAIGVRVLRGGAWKPRTSPYAFRGLGLAGLELMGRVARRHGLLVVSEVLAPADVPGAAAIADVLQIGARSMQCYPLLEAVGRAGRPVLLKRHPGATYEEWLLAAEHVLAAGERRVILCERGVKTFTPGRRSTLDLGAIPWAREATGLPVAVDPSHAAGCSRWVPLYARAAAAAGADLLLIEVHEDAARSRSDAAQALDLDTFAALHQELTRSPSPGTGEGRGGGP